VKKNGIARMVAGGAAGGFEDDERMPDEQASALSNAAESAVGDYVANMRGEAPAAKPAARMSDRKASDLAGRAERAVGGVVANLRGQPPRMSDSRAAALSSQADRAVGGVLANLRGTPAPMPARGIAHAALADMGGKAITGAERSAFMAPAPMPARGIAHAAVAGNRFAPIAGSMGAGHLVREDGTMKGQGFFGPLQHSSGRGATELSTGSGPPASFPYTHKDEMLYPSMVPTLSREELATMMAGDEGWPESIYRKSYDYAKGRLAQGKSPFAQVGEQYPAPGYEAQFMQQYPSAVMSYPNRTVGYQYAAGAPVTPYMSPVSSRPVPQSGLMSMMRRS
jgi:hypothetical protein